MTTDSELGDSILHKGGYLHYQAVDAAIAEEARLKDEARERGEDPEQYVLMRRLAEYGEQPDIPNKLGELRTLERVEGGGEIQANGSEESDEEDGPVSVEACCG
jgi:hypothetical protein